MRLPTAAVMFGEPGMRVLAAQRSCDSLRPTVETDQRVEGCRRCGVLADDPSKGACPACGVLSTSVRQRRTTRPRDLPYGEEALVVRWYKTQ